jgi:poly-gamma-glutamate capsule biosynthesis protein CapA/YwtB (metallophosphatase superfamily)
MYSNHAQQTKKKRLGLKLLMIAVLAIVSVGIYLLVFNSLSIEERIDKYITYDQTITDLEKNKIEDYIITQEIKLDSELLIGSKISEKITNANYVSDSYLPVMDVYAIKQNITNEELSNVDIIYDVAIEPVLANQINNYLKNKNTEIKNANLSQIGLSEEQVAIIASKSLNSDLKLLAYNDNYYLDEFTNGALYREIIMEGNDSEKLNNLKFSETLNSEQVYKTNITGVTALTRVMIRKLQEVGDPTYFSEKIGTFLADADLTHVSNEVSFKPNCTFEQSSVLSFCSPPEFIETLKASGVDLVELTGNHNNDFGSESNSETIEQYRSLGWGTVGGGLNNEDAAKPYLADSKGTKLAFLAYNYPDSPNGGAISGVETAGANSFDFAKIESDIAAAKEVADFVIVNVQYWECYAYPDGYVEFPECDVPIGQQEANFKKIIDLGADMVVGSSAHQPQTYEIYNGKPIYYGLGNLYFDQTSWPGTERGLVLSNYFVNGDLIQTKITPTVYGEDLQTRIMTEEEADYLLTRLQQARN